VSQHRFSIAIAGGALASWAVGVLAGTYFDSALIAAVAAAAFLVPCAIALFSRPFERAWWNVNRGEATGATQSLRSVVWMTVVLAFILGIAAYFENSVYVGALAGLVLGLTVFREVSARNFQ
jgi:hypothetical protein